MASGETRGTFASERNHPFVNPVILSKTPSPGGSVSMRPLFNPKNLFAGNSECSVSNSV
jgi:hypothetical protein